MAISRSLGVDRRTGQTLWSVKYLTDGDIETHHPLLISHPNVPRPHLSQAFS
jgi:hypothetical protein